MVKEAHGFDHYVTWPQTSAFISADEKNAFRFFHSFSQRKATNIGFDISKFAPKRLQNIKFVDD